MNTESCGKGIRWGTAIFACFLLLTTSYACNGNSLVIATSYPPSIVPTGVALASPLLLNTPTPACINSLTFISDLTIQDNTIVSPGSLLDKQWLVQNSGSCNWDSRYRLRLINGVALGASPEQALYPARAGLQARVQILFAAPLDAGTYTSEWQAFDISGTPFGDPFYIKIIVQP